MIILYANIARYCLRCNIKYSFLWILIFKVIVWNCYTASNSSCSFSRSKFIKPGKHEHLKKTNNKIKEINCAGYD